MSVTTNNYSTTQLHGDIVDGQQQKVMLNASIRDGKYLNLQVEVLDASYAAANAQAVNEAVAAFIRQACAAASQAGVPAALDE
jgi:hypothetical protein